MTLEVIETTAVNRETESGSETTISCIVTGLLSAYTSATWTVSGASSPISDSDENYVIGGIAFDLATMTQTTTLTVLNGVITADQTYTCSIFRADQSDDTAVNLKVFSLSSVAKDIALAIDQTLTCTVSGLTAGQDPVVVYWKEEDAAEGSEALQDGDHYAIDQGTVTSEGEQVSILTIKVAKLGNLEGSSVTYKCSAKSAQYPESAESQQINVVGDILTFGVEAKNSEVYAGESATISCIVTGLTRVLESVQWNDASGQPVSVEGTGIVIDDGADSFEGNTQTTVLTLPAGGDATADDSTYACVIRSDEHGLTDSETEVISRAFSVSALEAFYYSPSNIEVTVTGSLESQVSWSIDGVSLATTPVDQITASISTAFTGNSITFDLAFDMASYLATMPAFEVTGTVSLGDASDVTFPVGPFTVYKREFTEELSASLTFGDGDFPAEFNCAAEGEDKNLFDLSWKIGDLVLDDSFTLATITDTSEPGSSTEKKSQLTILANNQVFNNVIECVATWTGEHAAAITTTSDVNAEGSYMAPNSFSDGTTGDGVLVCTVWGDNAPHSVEWLDEDGIAVPEQEGEVVIGSTNEAPVYTHTLTFVDMTFGDEGEYTCKITRVDGGESVTHASYLSKLSASFMPDTPYIVHDGNVEFTCKYHGIEDPSRVEWFLGSTDNGDNLIASGAKYVITNGEFNVAERSKTSVITIQNTEVTDTGDYTCKWDTSTFDPIATMTIAIRYLSTTAETTYSLDGTISITCNYEGTSSGVMSWYHGDTLLEASDNVVIDDGALESNVQQYTLTITNANPEDNAGEYTCSLAFDDTDRSLDDTTEVIIRTATMIEADGTVTANALVTDGVFRAYCMLEADNPPSSVIWSKGDTNIEFDGTSKISNTNTKALDTSVKFFSNITIRDFQFTDEDDYKCSFQFADSNNPEVSLNVVSASITNEECIFIDFRTTTSRDIVCTYNGADTVTAVNFELPDESVVAGVLGEYQAGEDANTAGSQTGTLSLPEVTADSSGTYTCSFSLSGGAVVSAVQRVTAKKAMIESSTESLTPQLIERASITLTCTVASGAISIEWLKGDTVLSQGQDYRRVPVGRSEGPETVSVIQFTIEADSAGTYTCRATSYDDFCVTQEQYSSDDVVLSVISATPLEDPQSATAYGGNSHTFSCKFPDPFEGQSYEVVWSFKAVGANVAKPMIANGDIYNSEGQKLIDGTVANDDEATSGEIDSTLTIEEVTIDAAGEYYCTIKWGPIFIKSNPAVLTVNYISQSPANTNAVAGANVDLTCVTIGNAAATVSFHKVSDGTSAGEPVTDSVDDAGTFTTTSVLTITDVQDVDSMSYYCTAAWGDDSINSDNAYMNLLGIDSITELVWGVPEGFSEFDCRSDYYLKIDADGNDLVNENNQRAIGTEATATWEAFNSETSQWEAVVDEGRYNIKPNTFDSGLRVSPLLITELTAGDDGYRVRCTITWDSDTDNNFFGGSATSGEMTLQIASITSFTADSAELLTGETVTLSCVASAPQAPEFLIKSNGRSLDNSPFYTLVEGVTVTSDGTTHTATYKTTARTPNVLRGGENIMCEVRFGDVGTAEDEVTVTNFYDCSAIDVRTFNTVEEAVISDTDNGDGTYSKTITCPADTDSIRYSLITDTNSAATVTCSKETGRYEPEFLGSCAETRVFEGMSGSQIMNMAGSGLAPCHETQEGEFSPANMVAKLTSMTDELCGFRHLIPCLGEGTCSLDLEQSGCTFDLETQKLTSTYFVNFDTPVWTITERNALGAKEAGSFRFWDCSEEYNQRRRREAAESSSMFEMAETIDIIEKRAAVNGTSAHSGEDMAAESSSHYVAATSVGVCSIVVVTGLLALLFIRMRKRKESKVETLMS